MFFSGKKGKTEGTGGWLLRQSNMRTGRDRVRKTG